MTRRPFRECLVLGTCLVGFASSCSKEREIPSTSSGGAPATSGGAGSGGGEDGASGGNHTAGNGGEPSNHQPTPKYYPVPGFEDCVHAEVKADCEDGWCRLPPSCFVMGSPEDEWHRGLETENQVAVTLTHSIEVQQMELTRAEWTAITGRESSGPETCGEPNCPTAMVSWWDAVSVADVLSEKSGLELCYDPVVCTGTLGVDLECTGVRDPEKSIYECKGYRLPTRAEAEYAARAGTWSTWYSGDITVQEDNDCHRDAALEKIAWYCANSENRVQVGSRKIANGSGLQALIGNVSEWTGSPDLRSLNDNVTSSSQRIYVGGNFQSKAFVARTSNLLSGSWTSKAHSIGFRLYRTLFKGSERSKAIVSEP